MGESKDDTRTGYPQLLDQVDVADYRKRMMQRDVWGASTRVGIIKNTGETTGQNGHSGSLFFPFGLLVLPKEGHYVCCVHNRAKCNNTKANLIKPYVGRKFPLCQWHCESNETRNLN